MTTEKKYKCPKCGNMNLKDDSVLIGKRRFCNDCVGEDKKEVESIKETKVETTKVEEVKVEQPKVRQIRKFDMHDEVEVLSLVKRGTLVFQDHEGVVYEWNNFGDSNWLNVKSLVHMRNRHKMFFSEPWVRVDDDVAEFLKIKFDSTIDIDNIDSLFNLSNEEFENKLMATTNGIRAIVADEALNRIETGELDSRQKVRIIEKICKVELEEKNVREFTQEVKKK